MPALSRLALLRPIAAVVAAMAVLATAATDTAPHLQHLEGSAAASPRGDREWMEARPGQALQPGDRLWTDRGTRAELTRGGHTLRLDGEAHLTLDRAGPDRTQWSLRHGSLIARVRAADEPVEIDTPNLALRPAQPGLYRIDVDRHARVTRVQVLEGEAIVYGDRGQSSRLGAGRMQFQGRGLVELKMPRSAPADAFERWARGREGGPVLAAAPPIAAPATPATAAASAPAVAIAPAAPASTRALAPGRAPASTMSASRETATVRAPLASRPQARAEPRQPPSARSAPSARPPVQAQARTPSPQRQARGTAWDRAGEPGQATGEANAQTEARALAEAARMARLQEKRRREAWEARQRDLADQWRREHEDWLRYQEGLPPFQRGIPARRVG